MQFRDVIGQNLLKERLISTVKEKRISHAQLFLGNLGYGSLALALAYAQYINCDDRGEADSCGKCSSCLKMKKLVHPDLHFIYPVNTNGEVKSNALSDSFSSEWRELCLESPYFDLDAWRRKIEVEDKQCIINVAESQEIIKKLALKSYEASYKIMLIWKAELINQQAANKLLKTIEEPTDRTILILLSEDDDALLKTITSRTQITRVSPIDKQSLKQQLVNEEHCTPEKAEQIINLSNGSLINCMQLLNMDQERAIFLQLFKEWVRACYEANINKIAKWVNDATSKDMGREKQKRFLAFIMELIREATRRNYLSEQYANFRGEEDQFLQNFSPFIHENNLTAIIDLITEANNDINRNAYGKIIFMDISLKMANLLRAKKRTFVS